MSKDKKNNLKDKIKGITSDKKKLTIIGVAVLAVIALVVCICVFCNKKGSNEKELNANLKKLGSQFYEKFYYPAQEKSQEDVKAFVAKFKDSGIKVNLENISKVSSVDKKLVESMVNNKTDKKCDGQGTYVVIKPTDPYGKKDYKIETTLKCGFDGEKTETTKK